MKTVAEQLKDSLASIESLTAQLASVTAERDQAQADLSAAAQNTESMKAEVATLREQVATAQASLQAAEARALSESTRADEATARAEKAEKTLALDPHHLEISGRTAPVGDGTGSGDGASLLATYRGIKDRREQRAFYEKNREALRAEINQEKELSR